MKVKLLVVARQSDRLLLHVIYKGGTRVYWGRPTQFCFRDTSVLYNSGFISWKKGSFCRLG